MQRILLALTLGLFLSVAYGGTHEVAKAAAEARETAEAMEALTAALEADSALCQGHRLGAENRLDGFPLG